MSSLPFTSPPQNALLELLGYRVRLVSDHQAARRWYFRRRAPLQSAQRAFRRLESLGLVASRTYMICPELHLPGPLIDWQPGSELPRFGPAAYRLQIRWLEPPVRTVVVWATRKLRLLWGCPLGARPPRTHEVAHDLGLTTLFCQLAAADEDLARCWRHEDELSSAGESPCTAHVPDAVLVRPETGAVTQIIEFGGAYSARKLAALHAAYERHPYQVW